MESASDFVKKIRLLRNSRNKPKLYNGDESGYELELKPNFTLDHKGIRYVQEIVDSKSAKTHSYTILPLINSDGEFVSPLLIIMKETSETFGPVVERTMFKHPDLMIMCSKSGKMTKRILSEWYRKVLFSSRMMHNNILLFDSFPMHKDTALIKSCTPPNINPIVEFIPPGTTGQIQPLDNDLNRTLKEFVRELSLGYCKDNDPRIIRRSIHLRDSISLIQLLMFNQVRSPRYKG